MDAYLDHAATTPLSPEVREAMAPFHEEAYGNPSSRHPLGVRAAEALDQAKARLARAVGAERGRVVLTSGGTEANNLGVLGLARARRTIGNHVLVGPTEHPCVRESAEALGDEGFEVETARLDDEGSLDLEDLRERLRPDTVLVAQMLVNNEFGSVYPIRQLGRLMKGASPDALLHVDAVQALGKIDFSLGGLDCHSLAISAHKVHGPKGVGALVLAGEPWPRPLVFGGGQEAGLRSGTENVAGAVGFGIAAELAVARQPETHEHLTTLRQRLRTGLERIRGARLLEPGSATLDPAPHVAAVWIPGVPAEVRMHHLEELGVHTSTGSACQAKSGELSPALLALGLGPEEARQVLRISFASPTTVDEIDRALDALAQVSRALDGPASPANSAR